jgi:hypothetical protein
MQIDLLVLLNGHDSSLHVHLQGNLQAIRYANVCSAFGIARGIIALSADEGNGAKRRPECSSQMGQNSRTAAAT